MAPGILTIIKIYLKESEQMDTPIPEFLAEAANKRVSDIFISYAVFCLKKVAEPVARSREIVWKPVTMTFRFPFPASPVSLSTLINSVVPWLP